MGAVSGRAQRNYEKGARELGVNYLALIAQAGVDVLYVVTNVRAAVTADALSPRQHALMDHYNNSGQSGQRAIERVAMLEAQQQNVKVPSTKGKKAA